MTAHRKPPMLGKEYRGSAHCQWCNGEIRYLAGHKKAGELNTRRSWHDGRGDEPDCLYAYYLATRSDAQRGACHARDKGVCRECGTDNDGKVIGWRRGSEVWCGDDDFRIKRADRPADWFPSRYSEVSPIFNWEADHIMPLHLVDRSKPRDEILHYWGLDNLQTLCVVPCHQDKSVAEHRARAKTKRIRNKAKGGFAKNQRYRKKVNGKVERNPNFKPGVPW